MSRLWIGAAGAVLGGGLAGSCGAYWLAAVGVLASLFSTRRWDQRLLWVACVLLGAGAGAAESAWLTVRPPPPTSPFEGEVRGILQRGGEYVAVVAPDACPSHGVAVTLAVRPAGLAPGARVRMYGSIEPLRSAQNPGGFDPRAHGLPGRVAWRGRGDLWLVRPARPFDALAVEMQDEARRRLAALERPFGARVLAGVLLGDRRAVPDETRVALQATGAAHLMAVSGLHVGGLAMLVFALVARLARGLGAVRPWRLGAAMALPPTGLFVVLAGAPASAVRAGLMVTIYLLGVLLGRRCRALDALALAAVLLTLGGPSTAAGVGFQLSFVAVAALLVFTAGHRGVTALALTALVASLATAPIQAWHFGTVAPLGPVANLILAPFAALVVVPLGLFGLLCAPATEMPLTAAAAAAEFLSTTAETMAGWTAGPWVVGAWTAPLWALPLVVYWAVSRRRWWTASLLAGALGGLALSLCPHGAVVDFVSVGQGDAIVLRSGGRVALVDAGPQRSAFALGNYLRREGVARLDWVLITHGHPDHFRGLLALAQTVDIGTVWFNGYPRPGAEWRRLRAALERRGIPVVAAPAGRHRLGAFALTIFEPLWGRAVSENDASIAVRVEGPEGTLLLTGDLEAAGEAALLAAGLAPVDVLKAPHHGSRTSSGPALLRATCPRATVFSAGHQSRYGLPHPEVVARYARWGVAAWRTDQDGRVRVRLSHPAGIEAHRRPSIALTDLPRSCTRPAPEVALGVKEPRS